MSEDKDNWGPAMAALPNDFWRACALAFVEGSGSAGGPNSKGYSDALRKAGYKGTEAGTNSRAGQIFHDSRMLDALQELIRAEMKLGAPIAKKTMMEIMRTPGHKDQFNAAKAVLDRAGIVEQIEVKKTVEHVMAPETLHRLGRMADKLGIDRRKLLGWRNAEAIDVESVPVEAAVEVGRPVDYPQVDVQKVVDAIDEVEIPDSLRKLLS